MKKMIFAALAALLWNGSVSAAPIISGFNSSVLPKCDDCSSTAQDLGFTIDFNGQVFSSVYVNNNGNVTFGAANPSFDPHPFGGLAAIPIIAPFFADVDTTYPALYPHSQSQAQGTVSYGQGHYTGSSGRLDIPAYNNANAFGVTWQNVLPYGNNEHSGYPGYDDPFNTFQLLIIESDRKPGAFEIMFNVQSIQWLSGSASYGALGMYGFSDGKVNGLYYNGINSGTALLKDGNGSSLNAMTRANPAVAGEYVFLIETAQGPAAIPEPGSVGLLSLGLLALILVRHCRSGRHGW